MQTGIYMKKAIELNKSTYISLVDFPKGIWLPPIAKVMEDAFRNGYTEISCTPASTSLGHRNSSIGTDDLFSSNFHLNPGVCQGSIIFPILLNTAQVHSENHSRTNGITRQMELLLEALKFHIDATLITQQCLQTLPQAKELTHPGWREQVSNKARRSTIPTLRMLIAAAPIIIHRK